MRVNPDNMVITAGTSQGLDLICTLFSKPGGTIFVEEPTYFLALRIFQDHDLHVIPIPLTEDGLDFDVLYAALQQRRPDFIYVIPSYQNPRGYTMSAEQRSRLVQIAGEEDVLIVADEVYHLLNYAQPTPPALAAYYDDAPILSLGSFSKILAPGLRLGWIQGSAEQIERIAACGLLDSGGCANQFTAALVRSVMELDLLTPYLAGLKSIYAERAAALSKALREQIPEADFDDPTGGFFHWLTFPNTVDTEELLLYAQLQHVSYVPGSLCSSLNGLRNQLRLSFAFHDMAAQAHGVERLRRALDTYNRDA